MHRKLLKEGGLFVVEVSLPFKNKQKNHEVSLVFDTGAAITLVDADLIHQLGYSAREDGIRRSSLGGAAGTSIGYLIKLPYFKCLDTELQDFEIACHTMETHLGVAGLLGMNFLDHFRMDLNYHSGKIHQIERIF